MKKFTKLLGIVLIIALVMSLGITSAFASDYKIKIDNAVAGETYNAYVIFDVTYATENTAYATPTPATNVPGVADPGSQHKAYSYTISTSSKWWNVIIGDATPDSTTGKYTAQGLEFTPSSPSGTYVVTATDSFNAATFATLLNNNKTGKDIAATGTADAETTAHPDGATGDAVEYYTGTLTLDVGAPGYIFVDTSLGSLCSLDTTEPTAIIRDKNTITSQDKSVQEDSIATGENQAGDGVTGYGDKDDVNVGDTVYYKSTVTIGAHAKNVAFHDTMTNSLTLTPTSIKVMDGSTDLTSTKYATDSTINIATVITSGNDLPSGETFVVKFDDAWTQSLTAAKTVTVTYAAVLNNNAVIGKPTGTDAEKYGAGNDNKSKVTYGNAQDTTEDWTRTYTWKVDVLKYMKESATSTTKTPLKDAEFFFYNSDKTKVALWASAQGGLFGGWETSVKDEDGKETKGTKLITLDTGTLELKGLDADVYYLVETAAPAGYNMLKNPIKVEIKSNTSPASAQGNDNAHQANGTATVEKDGEETSTVEVLNQSGTELPSTGGIGTTIFYVVGSILVIAAGVLLITKKRMGRD